MNRFLRADRHVVLAVALGIIMLAASSIPMSAIADDVSDGQRALRESQSYPWYDSTADSLKKVPLETAAPPASTNRNSDWKAKARQQTKTPAKNPAAATGGSGGDFSFVTALLWVFVALILVAIIGGLVWAFLIRETNDETELENMLGERRLQTDVERIENLPFDVTQGTGTLFDRARAAYESGKYREAMIFLYSHMLLQLDRHHWIRLSKSKTNRQYLSEIRDNKTLREIFRNSMLSFEHTFFGFHDLQKSKFEECWNSLQEFDSSLAKPATPIATPSPAADGGRA